MDGFLVVDKPEGMTSLDVVRRIKRRLSIRKAGHIGTLDPFATGVLPIALNEGTKLIPFLNDEPKRYEGTLKLGEETSTDDLTGYLLSRGSWQEVTCERLELVAQSLCGRIRQTPPMYSAVKMNGRPLYQLARKGVEIERKDREVHVFEMAIGPIDLPLVSFKVLCSKGTYIRALARDLGRRIGCGAHLTQLRRVQSGFFSITQAICWQTFKTLGGRADGKLLSWLIPLERVLAGFPEVVGNPRLVRTVRLGREARVGDLSPQSLSDFDRAKWVKVTSPEEGLVAILKSEMKKAEIPWTDSDAVVFRPLRIFRPQNRPGG